MSYVREQAMKDALQQASLRVGVQINSTALMSQAVTWKRSIDLKPGAGAQRERWKKTSKMASTEHHSAPKSAHCVHVSRQ